MICPSPHGDCFVLLVHKDVFGYCVLNGSSELAVELEQFAVLVVEEVEHFSVVFSVNTVVEVVSPSGTDCLRYTNCCQVSMYIPSCLRSVSDTIPKDVSHRLRVVGCTNGILPSDTLSGRQKAANSVLPSNSTMFGVSGIVGLLSMYAGSTGLSHCQSDWTC